MPSKAAGVGCAGQAQPDVDIKPSRRNQAQSVRNRDGKVLDFGVLELLPELCLGVSSPVQRRTEGGKGGQLPLGAGLAGAPKLRN